MYPEVIFICQSVLNALDIVLIITYNCLIGNNKEFQE